MNLCHYTSIESLYAILNGINNDNSENVYLTLWATHASFLNDLTEGRMLPNVLRRLGVPENTLYISELTQGYPFVISFSELEDDLNMWRCYADSGFGATIAFDKDEIEKALTEIRFNSDAKLNKCQYILEEDLIKKLKADNIEDVIKDKNLLPLSRLISKQLIYKHQSFFAEGEWRIILYDVLHQLRCSSNNIVPYREIRIPTKAIIGIKFGPKCDFEKLKFSTHQLLKSKLKLEELNTIKLEKSTVPLI